MPLRQTHVLRGSSVACLLSLLGLALAAPSGLSAAARPPATVTVWSHEHVDTAEFAVLAQAANEFNRRQHAYKIELVSALYREYDRWVRSAAINGTLPCLLNFDGPYLHELAWAGYLQPIDTFAPHELLTDMLPSVVALGSYHGRLYSLSQYESGLALYGNRRYLTQAGVRIPTLRSPWTLQEFESVLRKLQALPGLEYPIDFTANSGARTGRSEEYYTYAYAPILQGFGGHLPSGDGGHSAAEDLTSPQSIAAMKHFQQWFQRGWSRADLASAHAFPEGRAALSWYGTWGYPEYARALGRDLMLLPSPDFGHGIKTGMGAFTWGLSSTCRNPRGAWAFLDFLLSREQIRRMSEATGMMPARRSVIERSKLYGVNGPLRLFVQQLDAGLGVPRPATPGYGTITTAFADATMQIIDGGDVGAELRNAALRIDGEIARRHGYPHQ